ncbi:MAG: hypothetical protein WCL02_07320 [bacterium]
MIEISHVHTPIICSRVKCSLNKKIPINTHNDALATEKITDHLPSHDPFFKAKSQNILQII